VHACVTCVGMYICLCAFVYMGALCWAHVCLQNARAWSLCVIAGSACACMSVLERLFVYMCAYVCICVHVCM